MTSQRVIVLLCTVAILIFRSLEIHPFDVITTFKSALENGVSTPSLNFDFKGLIVESIFSVLPAPLQFVIFGPHEAIVERRVPEVFFNFSICHVQDYKNAEQNGAEFGSIGWALSWFISFVGQLMPYLWEKLENITYIHIVTLLAVAATPWIRPVETLKQKHLITHY